MPRVAKFEEKEFENPLYFQLAKQSNLLWTPGQVFEFFFGIDACVQADDPEVWKILGYKHPLEGLVLNDYNFGYVWRTYKQKRLLPTFKSNLFIQAKRPARMQRRTSAQKLEGLKTPYWRFYKTWHQQKALEKLSKSIGSSGLVVYASPAFDTLEDLYESISNKDIVSKTNFTKVENLSAHRTWVYDSAGTMGYGCSVVEKYEELPLLKQIQLVYDESRQDEHNNNKETASEGLSLLSKKTLEIVKTESENNNPRMVYLLNYMEDLYKLEVMQELQDFLFIKEFCNTHGLHWHVIG